MLKLLSRGLASAVLMTGLFAASQASAATICSNCLYGNTAGVYLGAHNSNALDGSGFRRENLVNTTGSTITGITDTWIFDLQPIGANAQINANFLPISPLLISNFTISLYSVVSYTNPSGLIGNALGNSGLVTAFTLGALQGSSVPTGIGASTLFPVVLPAGTYAFQITYDLAVSPLVGTPATPLTSEYSGQLRALPIPEPGSLALVGLALVGAAAASRRSRKA
jgi:hypothetical protein